MKIRMTIEVELNVGMEMRDDLERKWAEEDILIGDGNLMLHSNEIGIEVGIVTDVTDIEWIPDVCEDCNGTGSVEQIQCGKPASECCGGCTVEVDECGCE